MTDLPIEPLPLDSARWKDLVHVYGSAADMPDAIRRLERLEHIVWDDDGPLEEIGAAIFHQGDPNTGSYAAVPHLVRIAETRPPSQRFPLVLLCSWIEQYRTPQRPPIPRDLEVAYQRALIRAKGMAIDMLTVPSASWGSHGYRFDLGQVFQAIASLAGERRLTFLIDHHDEFEFCFRKVHGDRSWPPWPE